MRCGRIGLLLAAVCCGSLAQAQAPFPSKPIRFVITSPPGGANDILNRTIGAKLAEIIANTPEQFASHMRAQMKRLARLIKETGARPD